MTTFTTTDPESDELRLCTAVMDTYADDSIGRGGSAPSGYEADSVKAAFAADGIEFPCDGQQVGIGPDVTGTPTAYDLLEGAPLLDLNE